MRQQIHPHLSKHLAPTVPCRFFSRACDSGTPAVDSLNNKQTNETPRYYAYVCCHLAYYGQQCPFRLLAFYNVNDRSLSTSCSLTQRTQTLTPHSNHKQTGDAMTAVAAPKWMPSSLHLGFALLVNIVCSVGLIICLKFVMKVYNFRFVFAITTAHFTSQALFSELLLLLNVYERCMLPVWMTVKIGLVFGMGIVCMNLTLQNNTVGLYQVNKLMCVPIIMLIQYFSYGTRFSLRVCSTLIGLLVGVAFTIDSDIGVSTRFGLVYAVLASTSVATFQVMASDIQKHVYGTGISPLQFSNATSFAVAICVGTGSLVQEHFMQVLVVRDMLYFALLFRAFTAHKNSHSLIMQHPFYFCRPENSIFRATFSGAELMWLGASCMAATATNFAALFLSKHTSAVTVQVAGHFKTTLLIGAGLLMFETPDNIVQSLIGIFISFFSVALYSRTKKAEADLQLNAADDACGVVGAALRRRPAAFIFAFLVLMVVLTEMFSDHSLLQLVGAGKFSLQGVHEATSGIHHHVANAGSASPAIKAS
jgi:solute carrier family 35 protein E3